MVACDVRLLALMAASPALGPSDFGIGLLFWRIREAVIVADVDTGRVVLWNPGAEEIFGYPADEAIDRPLQTLIPEGMRADFLAGLAHYAETGRWHLINTGKPAEVPAVRKGGEICTIELMLTSLDHTGQKGRFILAVIRDVTERKRADEAHLKLVREQAARAAAEAAERRVTRMAEAQRELNAALQAALHERNAALEALQDATRTRDEFLAAASHDLRTPLTAILGVAQMLRRREARGTLEPARFLEALRSIEGAARQMSAIIDELLDLARLRIARPLDLHKQPLDLVALARQVMDQCQQITDRHEILLETTVASLVGDWDGSRLERAMANLLGNALKYSPDGGRVTLSLGQEGEGPNDWAVVSVRDEGLGIPAAELPRIFEPFRRASNVVGRISGTGIGLAAVRQVVEQHGGTVSAVSEEGRGSTFTLRLPLARDAADNPPASALSR